MDLSGDGELYPDDLYDQFPDGASNGFGPDEGFNTIQLLNDPDLFTEEAKENPAIQEFLNAPFSVSFIQFKSSFREAEYWIHTPHRVYAGDIDGIEGSVPNFANRDPHRIGTYVINHDATLAKSIMRSLVIDDGTQTGAIAHKQPEA